MEYTDFSEVEIAQLHAHRIVLFANRVIFDAQPPMTSAAISIVQDVVGGKLPEALITLWKLTSGGRLDYDLSVSMNGRKEAISWCELFYDGSNGYRDLTGWIEYERELAEESADDRQEVWDGNLVALPFGGFEYCDRIYIVVAPEAEDYGQVLAWKMGLPPAEFVNKVVASSYAACLKFSMHDRSGLSHTSFAASQFRVEPDQRSGLRAFAAA